MAVKQGGGKKARTPKTSKGVHGGGGKVALTLLEQTLLGKGKLATSPPYGTMHQGAFKR